MLHVSKTEHCSEMRLLRNEIILFRLKVTPFQFHYILNSCFFFSFPSSLDFYLAAWTGIITCIIYLFIIPFMSLWVPISVEMKVEKKCVMSSKKLFETSSILCCNVVHIFFQCLPNCHHLVNASFLIIHFISDFTTKLTYTQVLRQTKKHKVKWNCLIKFCGKGGYRVPYHN